MRILSSHQALSPGSDAPVASRCLIVLKHSYGEKGLPIVSKQKRASPEDTVDTPAA